MSRIVVSSTSSLCFPPPLPRCRFCPRLLNPAGVPRQEEQVGSEACPRTSSCGSGVVSTSMNEYVPCVTPSRLMRLSSLPSAAMVSPAFSNRRVRVLMSLSIFSAALPVHCVIKIRRSDAVSLLDSHSSTSSPFRSHSSSACAT